MLEAAAKRISELVGADARVLQVGASAEAFSRADDVLDDRPHEPHGDARFTQATWTTRDVCARVLARMFPEHDLSGVDPWDGLLWATGRADLPGRNRVGPGWRWHGAPLG